MEGGKTCKDQSLISDFLEYFSSRWMDKQISHKLNEERFKGSERRVNH